MLETKALLSGPLDANAGAADDQCPRRRHRRQRLGRNAACGCISTGPRTTTTRPRCSTARTTSEAGINSATIAVRGPMAYGYLKGESGIHRLVRISPFNAEGKRQTSFAAVDVSPEVSEQVDIEIRDDDLEEQVFRASGPGGQHVNKTSSAVRLIHHAHAASPWRARASGASTRIGPRP